jgi:hypothetical protein
MQYRLPRTKIRSANFELRRLTNATRTSGPPICPESREDQVLQLPSPYCEAAKMSRDDRFFKVEATAQRSSSVASFLHGPETAGGEQDRRTYSPK